MNKNIKTHYQFVENMINSVKSKEELSLLSDYHNEMVHNFQHERFIHLIVTLFFGALTLISIVILFIFSFSALFYSQLLLRALTALIVLILITTEAFYIRYYYQLENGVQRLYRLTEKIYKLNKSC